MRFSTQTHGAFVVRRSSREARRVFGVGKNSPDFSSYFDLSTNAPFMETCEKSMSARLTTRRERPGRESPRIKILSSPVIKDSLRSRRNSTYAQTALVVAGGCFLCLIIVGTVLFVCVCTFEKVLYTTFRVVC